MCQQSANSTVIMRLLCPPAIRWAPDRQKLAALCEEEGVVLSWSHCRNGLAVQFLCLPGGHHRCLHVHKSSGVRDVHILGKISTLHMHHERALLSREDRIVYCKNRAVRGWLTKMPLTLLCEVVICHKSRFYEMRILRPWFTRPNMEEMHSWPACMDSH